MRLLATIFLLLACASGAFATHVAVLETGVDPAVKKKVTLSDRQYLTNVLREEAVKQLSPEDGYTIMTRENISAMLPPGKAIEDCEGTCLAETGRNISADFVCQARMSSFGSKLALSAEIYETAGNKLVASFNGNGKNVEALLKVIKENAPDFFGKVKFNRDAGSGGIGEAPKGSRNGGRRVHGAGGIGDGSQGPAANEDADKVKVSRAKDVELDDDDEDMPRSNKPINDVPAVKNTQNRVWIRWGLIGGGSVLLTTGLVLAAFAGEEDEYETDYDTWEMKKKKGDDGTLQFGIGIALSIIGAAGIVVGFCF
ncbi:hypothetical protein SAMN05720761_10339 [Fibrobacter sp. UWCM]|uniref:hypothetical protein n=1 Tax=Fibrobacter sp. UWCM TaxID=1896208 RepID=UPI00091E40B7|nr:hypothetical protein [Fibrobacter sp. UWCM]SHG55786.1 hypothetical protein SAMN05720761_10339 [Fibrobacter sp. UWCM]